MSIVTNTYSITVVIFSVAVFFVGFKHGMEQHGLCEMGHNLMHRRRQVLEMRALSESYKLSIFSLN